MTFELHGWIRTHSLEISQTLPKDVASDLSAALVTALADSVETESMQPLLEALRAHMEHTTITALARALLATRDAVCAALLAQKRTKAARERCARVTALCESTLLAHLQRSEELWLREHQRLQQFREIDATRRLLTAEADPLTHVHNARYFHTRLEEEVERATRYNGTLSLLICDIDHFRQLNEERSGPAGDEALRAVAATLNRVTRRTDLVARISWDEFAVILPEVGIHGAYSTAEKIRLGVERVTFPTGHPLHDWRLALSIGVASCPLDAATPESLLGVARECLRQAKVGGRNRVTATSN